MLYKVSYLTRFSNLKMQIKHKYLYIKYIENTKYLSIIPNYNFLTTKNDL